MPSTVYYTSMRTRPGNNLPTKLNKLVDRAGLDDIDFGGRFVAIKIHFGEPGNLSFLRPNFAKVIVDYVKRRGGRPFLTDCNTLYVGRRGDAISHISAAYENGYTPFSTNCHVIIADGLRGTDERNIPVKNGEYVQSARIGSAIAEADIIISMTHFKGHEMTGFGGAIKNLGMGCGSRAGKMEQHCDGKPQVNTTRCKSCHRCITQCAHNAIDYVDDKAHINIDKCVGCGRCIGSCGFNAIVNRNYNSAKLLNYKMAEYAQAVVQDKPCFHINFVMDVSPECDCRAENDAPIIPDIGIFASFDPVALDRACVDACNTATPLPNTQLTESVAKHGDCHEHFANANPNSDWQTCLAHCEKIGVGTNQYTLIEVE
ncbi:MAG: DUF362 domain-containing protein [Clostridia bacterium]|nr:DUF362 domain-containing protein [Clostridia bacterium]